VRPNDRFEELIRKALENPRNSSGKCLAETVRDLSQGFVHFNSGKYGDNADKRRAYALYYMLANMPKIRHIFNIHAMERANIRSVIDIGSGPGTSILGLMTAMNAPGLTLDALCVDQSSAFSKLAAFLIQKFRKETGIAGKTRSLQWDLDSSGFQYPAKFDLMIMANVIGELPERITPKKLKMLAENHVAPSGYLLLMEPAMMRASRRLIAVREILVKKGWKLIAPCPGGFPCPALARKEDWCYAEIPWTPPSIIDEIDASTGFDKRSLKFTYFLLKKDSDAIAEPGDSSEDGNWLRAVSSPIRSKGKMEAFLCGESVKVKISMEMRHKSELNLDFDDLRRYDRVKLKNTVSRGSITKLDKNSSFIRLKSEVEIV
jgi:ribosomal protein RSM22 (predicted rRNA methylase)